MELVFQPLLNIAALCHMLMLGYFFFKKEKIYTATSIFYGVLLAAAFINALFDTVSAWTITYAASLPLWLNHVVNIPIFLTNVVIPLSFMLMCMSLSGKNTFTLREASAKRRLIFLPTICGLATALSTPFTGAVYYFDSEGNYLHGPCFILLYGITVFYVSIGLLTVIKNRARIPREQLYILYLYVGVSLLAIGIQTVFPNYLIIASALSVSLLSMYMTFQNPDIYIDKLTGLFNREAFIIKTKRIFRHVSDDTALIYIHLVGLKSVNNRVGYSCGDEMLVKVAKWLDFISTGKSRAYRIGGSEFAVSVRRDKAEMLAETVRERFSGEWKISVGNMHLPFALCRIDVKDRASDQEALMKLIESVSDITKTADDGSTMTVDENMVAKIGRRVRIESLLRDLDGSVNLYWQPIYAVRGHRITHVEVLMRMNDPELGSVPPDEFIAVAEKSGEILGIGLWVLENTCRFIEENRVWERGLKIIAINLSMMECIQPNAAQQILEVLGRYPRARHYIGLEITETTLSTSSQDVIDMMNELSEEGVIFALDDFGCGFSNLESVIKFPFTSVKMDKGLLWSAMSDQRARSLYINCVRMFREMGLMIVAEGAETDEHLKLLDEAGVDFIQGYYFSRPLPKEEFLGLSLDGKE